ncbi:hypothetical protein [Cesiribacter sp. SM1]|uniref:hypothetical protein n=1 Tax=Cesiribacter sp. SM1 TaxID=2861196 RepID=UPI001CD22A69|nr:hypothetical protein [Cesiribacter sp. SM1]
MKAQILTLAFSLMCLLPGVSSATGEPHNTDTLTAISGGDPTAVEEVDFSVDEHFVFQEKVYIHIYDQQDKPVVSGSFTSQDLKENKALKDLLRKSTRFMTVNRNYYYFLNEG